MKKLITLLAVLVGMYIFMADALMAQPTTTTEQTTQTPEVLDEKTQKKVNKAKIHLAKDKIALAKAEEKYHRNVTNYYKNKSKGRLSPNDELKEEKAKQRAEKNISKLKKKIADNEAFLERYKM